MSEYVRGALCEPRNLTLFAVFPVPGRKHRFSRLLEGVSGPTLRRYST